MIEHTRMFTSRQFYGFAKAQNWQIDFDLFLWYLSCMRPNEMRYEAQKKVCIPRYNWFDAEIRRVHLVQARTNGCPNIKDKICASEWLIRLAIGDCMFVAYGRTNCYTPWGSKKTRWKLCTIWSLYRSLDLHGTEYTDGDTADTGRFSDLQ